MYDDYDKDVVEGDLAAHGLHITDGDDDIDGIHDDTDDILPVKKKVIDDEEPEVFEFDDIEEEDSKELEGLDY